MSEFNLSKTRLARMHDAMSRHVESGYAPGLVTLVARHARLGTRHDGGAVFDLARRGGYRPRWCALRRGTAPTRSGRRGAASSRSALSPAAPRDSATLPKDLAWFRRLPVIRTAPSFSSRAFSRSRPAFSRSLSAL